MKILDIVTSANSNLFRNKTRTFLTILAVFIGSFTIILSNAINAGVNDFIDKQVESIGGDGFIQVLPSAMMESASGMMMGGGSKVSEYEEGKGDASTVTITDRDLEKMRAVEGVKELEILHNLSTEWLELKGSDKKYKVSLEYFPEGNLNLDLTAGRMTDDEAEGHEIVITEDWLEPLGFESADESLGKEVVVGVKQKALCTAGQDDCVRTVEATIVGVQAPGILTMDGDLHINKGLDGEIYELSMEGVPESLRTNIAAAGNVEPERVEEIREKFKELGYSLITVDDEAGMIRSFFDIMLVVFNIFGGIALVAASIGIINTLFMSVQERTREIGLMKAMGMSNGKIFLSFSCEAILLGFWGSVVGIVVSAVIGAGINQLAHNTFLADFPTFTLVKFNFANMAIITLIIMFIAFAAGTLPARRAARKNPIDALRYE